VLVIVFIFIIYDNSFKEKKNKITKQTYKLIKKINEYIIICRKGMLLEGIKKPSKNILATVVISSYNSEKTIKRAIRSVQNQKMSDIEIIIVEDCSIDNTLELLVQLQKEDSRIKLLVNKKNKGALYTKSIGTLKAQGQYLLLLDSDDLFINKDIFNICYRRAEKGIDIIEFSGFYCNQETLAKYKNPLVPYYLRFKQNNEIITQPRLSNFIYEQNNNTVIKLIDGFLCAKFMRTEIFQKTLKFLGDWIYSEKVNYGDDRIINFALFKIANSFQFINIYGLLYYNNSFSITNSINDKEKSHDELVNIMSIFNITRNSSDIKYAIYELYHRWNMTIYNGLNEVNNKEYAKNLINLILKSKYIQKDDMKKLNFLLKDFI
jgi:glycosyltransferase involved in cell wall biosynthesis